ncbi:Catsper1, partial [Symbiodinium microadriaticum]
LSSSASYKTRISLGAALWHATMPEDASWRLEEEEQRLLLLLREHHDAWERGVLQAFARLRADHGISFDKESSSNGPILAAAPSAQPAEKELQTGLPIYLTEAAANPEMKDKVHFSNTSRSCSSSSASESEFEETMTTRMSSDDVVQSNSPKALKTAKTMAGLLEKKEKEKTTTQKIMAYAKAKVDYAAALLVLLNSMVMFVELEFEGGHVGTEVHLVTDSSWPALQPYFRVIDNTFVVVFILEWLFRVLLERIQFFKDPVNYFDTLLVMAGVSEIVISISMTEGSRSVLLLRLMRVLKSMRAVRMVRSLRFFGGLRSLVRACQCFLPSLCWSMVLLVVLMTMGALLLGNLLQGFILDDEVVSLSLEDRQWLWRRYGTASRATYTLFEITFAGNWPSNARPVLENVSYAFVVFFVFYVTVVVFAILRVISAVFLKDTLDAAQSDAEQMVVERMKLKADFAAKLEGIFNAIDHTGNGMITEDRLAVILENPKVKAYFQLMDLDVHESHVLFDLLDNGDGQVTLEEFVVALHSEMKKMDIKLGRMMKL